MVGVRGERGWRGWEPGEKEEGGVGNKSEGKTVRRSLGNGEG